MKQKEKKNKRNGDVNTGCSNPMKANREEKSKDMGKKNAVNGSRSPEESVTGPSGEFRKKKKKREKKKLALC